jgi:hypothetical protein
LLFGRCPGCLGEILVGLLQGLPRLNWVDRSYVFERLADLNPPDIDPAATKELFTLLSVSNELEIFGMEEGFPDFPISDPRPRRPDGPN